MTDAALELVAVTDGAPVAGKIVFWKLSGGVSVEKLAEAWTAAGLDAAELPEGPTPAVALSRAVREAAARGGRFPYRLKSGGWALLEREPGAGETVRLEETCRARLDLASRAKVEPKGHPLAPAVKEAFARASDEVEAADVRPWLVRQVRRLDGVALRPDGGVYFLPRTSLGEWEAVRAALVGASASAVFGIPALPGSELVEAVLDAASEEARAEADALVDEINAPGEDGPPGLRAILNRQRSLTEVEEKLGRYEELLGAKVEGIRARLEEVRATLLAAEIRAAGIEEKARAS